MSLAPAASSDGHGGASEEDAGDVLTPGCERICPSFCGTSEPAFCLSPKAVRSWRLFFLTSWREKRLGNVSRLLVVPKGSKYWGQMNTRWVVDEPPAPLPFLGKKGSCSGPQGDYGGSQLLSPALALSFVSPGVIPFLLELLIKHLEKHSSLNP